jgi:hypothetical protein
MIDVAFVFISRFSFRDQFNYKKQALITFGVSGVFMTRLLGPALD